MLDSIIIKCNNSCTDHIYLVYALRERTLHLDKFVKSAMLKRNSTTFVIPELSSEDCHFQIDSHEGQTVLEEEMGESSSGKTKASYLTVKCINLFCFKKRTCN